MMAVGHMRKGKHLGQPTPLDKDLVKQGATRYGKNAEKQITLGKNPAGSMKHAGKVIKQGNPYKMGY